MAGGMGPGGAGRRRTLVANPRYSVAPPRNRAASVSLSMCSAAERVPGEGACHRQPVMSRLRVQRDPVEVLVEGQAAVPLKQPHRVRREARKRKQFQIDTGELEQLGGPVATAERPGALSRHVTACGHEP